MVLASMGAVIDFVGVGVQGAGGNFVQQGLPDMGQTGVHQGNAGFLALAQFISQTGDQFQATGTAADDHNMMQVIHNSLP